MREFVNKHPKLYWCVVVALAVLAFAIVTCVGFGKLERAEAAESVTVDVIWNNSPASYTFNLEDYPYYAYCTNTGKYGGSILYLSETPIQYFSNTNQQQFWLNGRMFGSMSKPEFYQAQQTVSSYTTFIDIDWNVFANHDVLHKETGEVVFAKNIVGSEYSPDSAYVKYQSLIVENKLNKSHDVTVNEASHLYSEYFATSNWDFIYDLKNISELDTGYKLNLKFEVELPTLAYVRGLYEDLGYNFESARTILRRNPEAIKYWLKDKNAEVRTVVVNYSMDVTPSVYENVVYQFTYLEWEYLLRASSAELNAELEQYDARERATLLSFMHVKKVTTEVITSRGGSEVYGGYTTNVFERGVYDSCVDVYTAVDKNFVTDDLLNDMISDDVKVAEKEYLKQLEQKVEDLQNQVDNITGSLGSFDLEFDGNAFWSAVRSVGAGLLTLSDFLLSLVAIISGFFVFLPFDMQQIIGYLVIVTACVILWKAFKK